MYRTGVECLADALEILRAAPRYIPVDVDAAQFWATVTTLAGGSGSAYERALELTEPERSKLAKALLLTLCWMSAEVGHGGLDED